MRSSVMTPVDFSIPLYLSYHSIFVYVVLKVYHFLMSPARGGIAPALFLFFRCSFTLSLYR